MTDPATRYALENLTLQEATIATQALGKHRVDVGCTCICNAATCSVCEQCMVFFLDGPIDAYEKAIEAESRNVWQEHVKDQA
jgi:hypothetical protein